VRAQAPTYRPPPCPLAARPLVYGVRGWGIHIYIYGPRTDGEKSAPPPLRRCENSLCAARGGQAARQMRVLGATYIYITRCGGRRGTTVVFGSELIYIVCSRIAGAHIQPHTHTHVQTKRTNFYFTTFSLCVCVSVAILCELYIYIHTRKRVVDEW